MSRMKRIHYWIMFGWLVVYVMMWGIFQFGLPRESFSKSIESLKVNVIEENWKAAQEEVKELEKTWKNAQLLIQVNNGTAAVGTFGRLLEQAKVLINNEEDDALATLAELQSTAQAITAVIPGP